MNYNQAEAELLLFENFKKKKFHPTFQKAKSKVLRGEEKEIWVDPPDERGKDLHSGKNLFDHLCKVQGRMMILCFFCDHKK